MGYIEKIFKKSGWISILESVIFVILGIILIANPEGTVTFVSWILGLIFICTGIYKTINYLSAKGKYDLYNYDLVYGILAVIIGIVTIAHSGTIGSVFRVIIGIWIIYSSIIRASLSIKLKNLSLNIWKFSLMLSVIMFILGMYVTMNSGAVVVTIGVMIIISSIIDIIEDIIFIKNVKEIF